MGEVASGDVVGKLKAAEAKWLALTPHLAESLKPIAAQAVRAAASLPLLCRPAAVHSDGGGLNNPSDPLPSPPPAPATGLSPRPRDPPREPHERHCG